MSSVLEFWPFNYERYTEVILPALMEAMQDNAGPLLELVAEGESERLNMFNPYFLDAQGNKLIGLTHITNDWRFLHVLPVEVYESIDQEYEHEGPLFQRYVQEHRHSVETMRREYMESVWREEEIILRRLEFAAERGLGMLKCYVSGG